MLALVRVGRKYTQEKERGGEVVWRCRYREVLESCVEEGAKRVVGVSVKGLGVLCCRQRAMTAAVREIYSFASEASGLSHRTIAAVMMSHDSASVATGKDSRRRMLSNTTSRQATVETVSRGYRL